MTLGIEAEIACNLTNIMVGIFKHVLRVINTFPKDIRILQFHLEILEKICDRYTGVIPTKSAISLT